ncbi:iron-sulfur cluster repair di-iron protein [Maribacter arenosus]|uniref:Iron-sulfur cluster repair di-iron protein n=1 Tax=Maribacter arenosus TaxID=1854708 RepID=A0ABR7V8Y9_9FLAO|nr:iron-sulfur cluster repair di-iron protein [Maribacter arenosus]MBD0850144.1 iron-sulfur cluster repair di-iron protein [Maribacter arenosus]
MENTLKKNIGEIVAEDYRTAQIFKNHKIDFCCKGNRSIQEVADKNNLDADLLLKEIEGVQLQGDGGNTDFKSWPLDLLADYIEKKHHRYVAERIPVLQQYLNKLCQVHGERHPELFEITEHFNASAGELAMHMKKEELIVFPAVRKMVQANQTGTQMQPLHFGTIQNPIQVMMQEHDNEGERFRHIEALSNGYTPPADGCTTYNVTYSLLKEFEDDLHNHIHLENNILFPKAEILEKQLADPS